jgi:methyl-accepting chemotaxis protein
MKLTIGKKVGFLLGFLLALMMVDNLLVYLKATNIKEEQKLITSLNMPTIIATKEMQRELSQMTSKGRQAILASGNKEDFEKAKGLFETQRELANADAARLDELAPRFVLQANRDRLKKVEGALGGLYQGEEAAMTAAITEREDGLAKAGVLIAQNGTVPNEQIKKELEAMAASMQDYVNLREGVIDADFRTMIWVLFGVTLLSATLAIVIGTLLGRSISSSTGAALERASAIADGDLSGADVPVTTNDEMKDLTLAINKMQSKLLGIVQSITNNAQKVATASGEVSHISQQISANSEETSAQAGVVSAATEEVNRNLQTVATATEEMTASIHEIARNATEAAKIAEQAMNTATETNAIVIKLGESSTEIGQVIKVITSIAQKTDLLALNATVEAARAGEVGAGFAVVANEVKELAKQTATATEDISKRIETIQADAKNVVAAIGTIGGIIRQVNQISSTIAAAVQEQSSTTGEMARNLTEAAKGSGEVAQNIHGVAQAAQNTSQGATDSQRASKNLAGMSTQLLELVGQFKLSNAVRGRRSERNGQSEGNTEVPQESDLAEVGAR